MPRVAQASPKRSRFSIHKRLTRRRVIMVATAGLLLVVGSIAALVLISRPALSGEGQLQQVETAVGKHYLLPTDEQPVLATVEDQTQLRTPFLKQAKNGDRVLIYAKAKLAIIYRPSIDRIIAVGPVQLDQASNGSAATE